MKDQEITVGSRWRLKDTTVELEIKVLAVGEEAVFCRYRSGLEDILDLGRIRESFMPIKETKELYFYADDHGNVWQSQSPKHSYRYRSEHPISFVEVE